MRENLGALDLSLPATQLARLDSLVNAQTVSGNRYGAQASVEVDTEVHDAPVG